MKKFLIGRLWSALLIILSLTACGTPGRGGVLVEKNKDDGESREPLKVVTTLFPYYDFAKQIGGDRIDLALVLPAGMDSHSFEPTPADMRTIQEADLLICNGGAMEHWLSEALDALEAPDLTVVTMMDYVDVVEEELVEGMEAGGHAHDHQTHEDHIDHDGHEVEIQYDEHIWTSPVNAMRLVEVIRDELVKADPEGSEQYRAGGERYLEELRAIDAGFRQVCAESTRNMIIVGDQFPFRYFAKEYGLDYRAAFSGCSTDTEPSAKTIAYLVDKVREKEIPVVYYLERSSSRVSRIIGEETGASPLLLHSCHNVTRTQFDEGVTYAGLMRQNIENLRKGICE